MSHIRGCDLYWDWWELTHLSPYSYRCLVKMEDINHQSRVVTDSNYMFAVHWLFSVGMELNRFPSGWGWSRTLARPSSYEKSHVSLCQATREFTLWNPSPHHLDFHPCRRSKRQMCSFIISTERLCMLLLSRVQPCLIGQMDQVLML